MIFSKGFVYRLGVRIIERGERIAHIRFFGIPLFRWCDGYVIALGYKIKGLARNIAVGEL